eukprot:362163_1
MTTSKAEDVELHPLSGTVSRTPQVKESIGCKTACIKYIKHHPCDIILPLMLLNFITMIILEIFMIKSGSNLSLDGCCGIVSNNGYADESASKYTKVIPGVSTLCSTKNIDENFGFHKLSSPNNYCFIPNMLGNDTI